MLTILADNLFDGLGFRREPVRIDITGDVIAGIIPLDSEGPFPPHALDVRGSTLLPGLINTHTHIARGGMFRSDEPFSLTQVIRNLEDALASGVTTVGDMGCAGGLVGALRDHVGTHPGAGPSIVAAGPIVTTPEGYPFDWLPPLSARLGVALPCSNEAEARRAVRLVHRMGMDFVKLAVMHRSYAGAPLRVIREDTARSIVAEARELRLRVLCHAHFPEDYRLALAVGVDALMHSSFEPLDTDTVKRVRDSGVPVCPTIWVFESALSGPRERLDRDPRYRRHVSRKIQKEWTGFCDAFAESGDVMPPGMVAAGLSKALAGEAVRTVADNLAKLIDAGVPIAFGSDASYGFSILSRPVDELRAMQRAGMSLVECLRAATVTAADLLGLKDRGCLKPGMRADMVVLDGALDEDLAAIEEVREVIAAGRRLADRRPAEKALSRSRTAAAVLRGLAATAYWSSFAKIESVRAVRTCR